MITQLPYYYINMKYHSKIIMQLISSESWGLTLRASSTKSKAKPSLYCKSSFNFFRITKDISLSFMKSYRPSEPSIIKSI